MRNGWASGCWAASECSRHRRRRHYDYYMPRAKDPNAAFHADGSGGVVDDSGLLSEVGRSPNEADGVGGRCDDKPRSLQGVGIFVTPANGLLIDDSGDDCYRAAGYGNQDEGFPTQTGTGLIKFAHGSQGSGFLGGFGAMFDLSGYDDTCVRTIRRHLTAVTVSSRDRLSISPRTRKARRRTANPSTCTCSTTPSKSPNQSAGRAALAVPWRAMSTRSSRPGNGSAPRPPSGGSRTRGSERRAARVSDLLPALGVGMTEPVEGWIRRAGQATESLGATHAWQGVAGARPSRGRPPPADDRRPRPAV